MTEHFLGIDLGGTNVPFCLCDRQGKIVAQADILTRAELGPLALMDRLTPACQEMIEQSGISSTNVKAVGIGCPGLISVKEGKMVRSPNLPSFNKFPFRAELSQRLQVPAVFDNDAKLACWGEFWLGGGKGANDMILLTLGTGIGGGIVSDGELIHGSEDNAAELGHMIIVPNGRRCNCGQKGCLEAYASASHTVARAIEQLDNGRASNMNQTRQATGAITCKDVFDHARDGDELANEIIDGTTRALAQACVNFRHMTEPRCVVLGGGMINAGDILLDRVRAFYNEMMWSMRTESMEIYLARLGHDAGVIGAAGLALHAWEKDHLIPIGR